MKNPNVEVTRLRKNFRVLVNDQEVGTYATKQRATTAVETTLRLSEMLSLNLKVGIKEIEAPAETSEVA